MTDYIFSPPPVISVPVIGSEKHFPVNRIFCVGRNYLEHAKEMGSNIDREQPTIFTKPASAIVESGNEIPYPPGTQNFHYEMELVVALGSVLFEVTGEEAKDGIFGFACGLDLTRRDLQALAKKKFNPWDMGKAFEKSAIISPITQSITAEELDDKTIQLSQNGQLKQQAKLADMIWRVEEVIVYLSQYYHLEPGDLIYTGTPAGVGPIEKGDHLHGSITSIGDIDLHIQA